MTNIQKINQEVAEQLRKKGVLESLIATTFKGLTPENVEKAIIEGIHRGFLFDDFLQKNVYAIPFGNTYSLVTSIDYARKIGMRSGVVGKSEPTYEEKDGKIISCSITIKRKIGEYIGDYSSKVYFAEYTTGRNLWTSKPRTMIAKVAETHALRMACPEEMSQVYVEEEFQKETVVTATHLISEELIKKVEDAKTLEELKEIWEKNKGLGKDFAKIVIKRKAELTTKKN